VEGGQGQSQSKLFIVTHAIRLLLDKGSAASQRQANAVFQLQGVLESLHQCYRRREGRCKSAFARFHCAEKLGIPLHLVFTFPYTPTQSFPPSPSEHRSFQRRSESYQLHELSSCELVIWQGLGELVNKFRVQTLGLEPMSDARPQDQIFWLCVP